MNSLSSTRTLDAAGGVAQVVAALLISGDDSRPRRKQELPVEHRKHIPDAVVFEPAGVESRSQPIRPRYAEWVTYDR